MPTVAIVGGGPGGNLVAVRLLARAPEGQRLNVMLIEARNRASRDLRALLREAEGEARGAFLTRLRGEVAALAPARRGAAVHLTMRTGRLLEADRAVIALGSYAAAQLPGEAIGALGQLARTLPSDAPGDELEELAFVADEIAAGVVAELGGQLASGARPSQSPPDIVATS